MYPTSWFSVPSRSRKTAVCRRDARVRVSPDACAFLACTALSFFFLSRTIIANIQLLDEFQGNSVDVIHCYAQHAAKIDGTFSQPARTAGDSVPYNPRSRTQRPGGALVRGTENCHKGQTQRRRQVHGA